MKFFNEIWKVGWKSSICTWVLREAKKINSQKHKPYQTRDPEPELSREKKIKLCQERLLKLRELDAVDEIKQVEAQLKKLQEGNE